MSNISIHLTNLTAKDAQFITGVIALFTDPRNDEQSDLVRSGRQLLHYTPTGRCLLVDPENDATPGPAQIDVVHVYPRGVLSTQFGKPISRHPSTLNS